LRSNLNSLSLPSLEQKVMRSLVLLVLPFIAREKEREWVLINQREEEGFFNYKL